MTGERTAGTIILDRTPIHCTPSKPIATIAEPIRPPNRACDEDEGRPRSQVKTFQRMPPTRPVKTMSISAEPSVVTSIRSRFTMPLPTERATSTERNAPTRFRDADSATAVLGFSAPVAMEVAIALPVSWKPFVKSKASAVSTTITRIMSSVVTRKLSVGFREI